MYTYIYLNIQMYVYIYLYIYTYIYIYIYACMCIYICIFIYVHNVYIHTCTYICVYLCIFIPFCRFGIRMAPICIIAKIIFLFPNIYIFISIQTHCIYSFLLFFVSGLKLRIQPVLQWPRVCSNCLCLCQPLQPLRYAYVYT